jgi:hypothetical protein
MDQTELQAKIQSLQEEIERVTASVFGPFLDALGFASLKELEGQNLDEAE